MSVLVTIPEEGTITIDKSDPIAPERVSATEVNTGTSDSPDENIFDTDPEISVEGFTIGSIFDTYRKLGHIDTVIRNNGVSADLVHGLNLDGVVYDLLPDMPPMEDLPTIGDPDSDLTINSLESLGSIMRDFWTWLKRICSDMAKAIVSLIKTTDDNASTIKKKLIANAQRISKLKTDHDLLKSTNVQAVPYKVHKFMVDKIPDLEAEWIIVGAQVIVMDRQRLRKAMDTSTLGTISEVAQVSTAVSTGMFGDDEFHILRKLPAKIHGIITKDGPNYGKREIFTNNAISLWIKMGCQIKGGTIGAYDMTRFNEHEAFKPVNKTFYESGWNNDRLADTTSVIKAFATMDNINDFLKLVQSELNALVKASNKLVSKRNKNQSEIELQSCIRDRISGVVSVQKLANAMLKAIFTLAKNQLTAQERLLEVTD